MRISIVAAFLAGLSLAACGGADAPSSGAEVGVLPTSEPSAPLEIVKVLSTDEMGGRRSGTPEIVAARDFLTKELTLRGLTPVEHVFSFESRDGDMIEGVNLLARIEGKADGHVMVVTAHYDHVGTIEGRVFNGADDNASGVAGALAVADHFLDEQPEHDVVIALLDAEEMGLQGARALVRDGLGGTGGEIALNVNFDMLSKNDRNELYAAGAWHYPQLVPMLNAVAADAPVSLKLGHDDPALGSDDWTLQSDHGAFHRAEIPFVYFGVEDHADYHQPTDDFETVPQDFFLRSIETVIMAAEAFDTDLAVIAGAGD